MKIGKFGKFVTNLYDRKGYVIHTTNLKLALNNSLVLKKVNKDIKLNQKAWLKPYIDSCK